MTATTLDIVAELLTPRLDGAACKGQARVMDLPAWHANAEDVAQARAVCGGCPVFDRCRTWVMALHDADDPGGVLAGLTERERVRLRSGEPLLDGEDEPEGNAVLGKACPRCHRWRPLIAFYKRDGSVDGYAYQCATCHKAGQKRSRKAPPETQCGRCRLNLPTVAFGGRGRVGALIGICLNCRT